MRIISLLSSSGGVIQDPRAILKIYQTYPDEEEDRAQALLLFARERERWQLDSPSGSYQVSGVVQAVINSASKSDGQRATCGLVALMMLGLRFYRIKPSLNKAAKLVRYLIQDNGNANFYKWNKDQLEKTISTFSRNEPDIKSAFRRFRPAAALIAAEISCSRTHGPKLFFEWSDRENIEYILTVSLIQRLLRDVEGYSDWNAWWTIYPPSIAATSLRAVLPLSDQQLNFINEWIEQKESPVD